MVAVVLPPVLRQADVGTRTRDPLLTIGRKGVLLTREGPCLLAFLASRDWSGLVFGGFFPRNVPNSCPKSTPGNAGHRLCISEEDDRRSPDDQGRIRGRADVAQLVEHLHGKQEVSGSSPDVGLDFMAWQSRFGESLVTGRAPSYQRSGRRRKSQGSHRSKAPRPTRFAAAVSACGCGLKTRRLWPASGAPAYKCWTPTTRSQSTTCTGSGRCRSMSSGRRRALLDAGTQTVPCCGSPPDPAGTWRSWARPGR